jgi:hypothetical protein
VVDDPKRDEALTPEKYFPVCRKTLPTSEHYLSGGKELPFFNFSTQGHNAY